MRTAQVILLLALIALAAGAADAATTASSFDNFHYSYVVIPTGDEMVRSFHVYTSLGECDATHYYNLTLPDGWHFTTVPMPEYCVLTFWTEGDPLPVDQQADFGYVHYCAPCCHSWFLSDAGDANADGPVVDEDANHTEPCNIPAEFADSCGGPGLLLAPIYPVSVNDDTVNWGTVKSTYR